MSQVASYVGSFVIGYLVLAIHSHIFKHGIQGIRVLYYHVLHIHANPFSTPNITSPVFPMQMPRLGVECELILLRSSLDLA